MFDAFKHAWNAALCLSHNIIDVYWSGLCVTELNSSEETMSGRGESAQGRSGGKIGWQRSPLPSSRCNAADLHGFDNGHADGNQDGGTDASALGPFTVNCPKWPKGC
ncbi:hypothetical protein HHL24_00030 [Paraburkholderia sp. RP-4-7]|uniref:Uncharacterized protein n=1 Tax=Paraburkholderia polaris TaxID=2728848 RepID=A0A848I779_9BURK|nr:hypothetical protein [Paraburkholderia polaris]NML96355.1 hypothetical protein [Paraburkholderia polaris]